MKEMYRDSLSPKEQLMKDVSKIGDISNQEKASCPYLKFNSVHF